MTVRLKDEPKRMKRLARIRPKSLKTTYGVMFATATQVFAVGDVPVHESRFHMALF
jgi:hypothetical protein